ncbi:type VII secretion-associated serine protease mycosin [Dactylosporangium sp. NPDC051541]|uniref:type VII secretion-associated serine protease mycosin n=1 Tax=Dactylosporangium sp. NPDC051541 TaxID=3363977 RepID=UPI00379E7C1B
MQRKRWFAAIAALAAAASSLAVPAPSQAAPPPAGVCNNPAKPGEVVKETPWPQQTFAIDRVWPTTTGAGLTVAVIDSGVDGAHPQLAGQVLPGFDFLRNAAGADFDCTSHGTAVASLIAAKHANGVGFEGLAPGVRILPIRVSDHEEGTNGEAVTPDVFAKAIRYAADQNARIINISLSLDADYPAVAQAVDYATNVKGALIVAAVGNHHATTEATPPPIGANRPAIPSDPPSYPAAYKDVLGVAGINQDGTRVDESQVGNYVDITAPGNLVLAATRDHGHQYYKGTSFAAPLVSAAAALVWTSQPSLKNTDVAWRLQVTADRMAGAGRSNEFGYGLIDPFRAVYESVPRNTGATPAPIPAAAKDPAAEARLARWQTAGQIAALAGAAILVAALIIFAMRTAVRRGRARNWRPGEVRAVQRPQRDPDIEPEDVFFAIPTRNRSD